MRSALFIRRTRPAPANLVLNRSGDDGLFIVMRVINGYGDSSKWSQSREPAFTFFSFVNMTKYPPSLLFLLMTLGAGNVGAGLVRIEDYPGSSHGIAVGNRKSANFLCHIWSRAAVLLYVAMAHGAFDR